tara:strand:- start:215 stop:448 length:234 start_codon:yes stop_codon:yes gene_type:complete
MRVRVITPFARYYTGDVREVAPDLAHKWIRAGFAVSVDGPVPEEPSGLEAKDVATPPTHKMVKKARRKKKRGSNGSI